MELCIEFLMDEFRRFFNERWNWILIFSEELVIMFHFLYIFSGYFVMLLSYTRVIRVVWLKILIHSNRCILIVDIKRDEPYPRKIVFPGSDSLDWSLRPKASEGPELSKF